MGPRKNRRLKTVTTVDFIFAAILIFSLYRGCRSGLITGLFSFIGLVGGGILGLKYGSEFVSANSSQSSRIGLTAGIVVATAFVTQFLLRRAAKWFRKNFLWKPLKAVDSVAGGLLGLSKALVIIWIVGELAMIFPQERISRWSDQSSIIVQIENYGPEIVAKIISTSQEQLINVTN